MSKESGTRMDGLLARWTNAVTAHSVWVVLLAVLASGLAAYCAARRLAVNTDPSNMIAANLPFRQADRKCKELFPQYVDTLLVVVDARTPEAARHAASELQAGLKKRGDLFKDAFLPAGGPFLETHGLLFLSPAELAQLESKLAAAQPLLASLARDPSLRGLCELLGKAIDAAARGQSIDLTPLLHRINEGLEAIRAGKHYSLSWQELMGGQESTVNERRQLLLAQPRLDASRLLPAEAAMGAIHELARPLMAAAPGQAVRVRITGDVALRHEELLSVFQGTSVAGILSTVMVCLTLLVGLRSWRLTLITILTLIMGLALIAGFAAVTVGHLNMISIAFAVLYIGLGVDYAIYLCLSYRVFIERGHLSPRALILSVEDVGLSLIMCAVSTAIAFYAFIPTAYKGVSELGLIAGTGMLVSLLISLTVVPALLTLWPLRLKPQSAGGSGQKLTRLLFQLSPRRRHLTRALTLVAGVASLLALPWVRFDYNPFNLRDPASESIATLNDLIAARTITPWTVTVLAPNGKTAEETAARIRKLPSVDKAVTVYDFVPPEQDKKLAMIDDLRLVLGPEALDPPKAPPPSLPAQVATLKTLETKLKPFAQGAKGETNAALARLDGNIQALLNTFTAEGPGSQQILLARLQESLLGLLPTTLNTLQALLSAAPVTLGDLPRDLRKRWLSPGGVYRIEVLPKANAEGETALRHFVGQVRRVAPDATGDAVNILESGDAVVRSFQYAFIGALAAIVLILLGVMRSFKDATLVLFPLVLAGLLTCAATVLLRLPFNFANVITLPLLLGTGIESSIQVVQRMHRGVPGGGALPRSSTAEGIIYCTLTTIFSFGNLALTAHRGIASMGQLLTLGVVFTLVANLLILPAFLSRDRFKN